jgi:PAS domain S-box-containing protein
MARADDLRGRPSALRRRAEVALRRQPPAARRAEPADLRRVVHELEVHQVELEMQNQTLLDAQAALMEARDRYASLFDLAPVAYLVLDRAGAILQANEAARRLLGRPRHRLVRRALGGFVAASDRAALARHLEEAAVGPARPLEATLEGRDGRIVRLETVKETTGPAGRQEYRTAMIDLTDRILAEQRLRAERMALERSQAALREVTRRLISAEERERRRIAADLHDDVAQRLHAAQMELALVRRRPPVKAEASSRLDTVHQHLQEVLGDLETLARSLHPKIVDDLGLRVALSAYAGDLSRQAKMTVRFRERGVPDAIPPDVASCLYRVAQEALRNVHRHAAARAATVTLAGVRRGLGLCVADNGRGFDRERVGLSNRGLGLVTMQERVRAFDGHFRVRTNPGDGTHVHAWMPLP